MARSRRTSDYVSEFGKALDEQLSRRSMRQLDLATATGTSPAYINRMLNGAKVSPEWADTVAQALAASPEERRRLHVAAAMSWGYRLDLTKPD